MVSMLWLRRSLNVSGGVRFISVVGDVCKVLDVTKGSTSFWKSEYGFVFWLLGKCDWLKWQLEVVWEAYRGFCSFLILLNLFLEVIFGLKF